MFIMVEVTVERAEELKASAAKQNKSVAAEVGDRLERLAKLEAKVEVGLSMDEQARREWCESLYSGAPNPWDMFRNKSNGR